MIFNGKTPCQMAMFNRLLHSRLFSVIRVHISLLDKCLRQGNMAQGNVAMVAWLHVWSCLQEASSAHCFEHLFSA